MKEPCHTHFVHGRVRSSGDFHPCVTGLPVEPFILDDTDRNMQEAACAPGEAGGHAELR